MNAKIMVATHKKYKMPKEDIYVPIQVGAELYEDIGMKYKDNVGENISEKNPNFCELTALYWGWKNLDADYIGLAHYRRHFSCKKILSRNEDKRFANVLSKSQLEEYLKDVDIILPKKRNYYIENVYSHYKNTMYIEPLDEVGNIIKEKYSTYYPEFEKLKTKTSMHAFNMMIMKKEILNDYCTWLFDILFELEKRIDASQYDKFHARFFGRVSERMLDIWINTNGYKYKEIKVIDIQGTNWFKKGFSFLNAKLFKAKYQASF